MNQSLSLDTESGRGQRGSGPGAGWSERANLGTGAVDLDLWPLVGGGAAELALGAAAVVAETGGLDLWLSGSCSAREEVVERPSTVVGLRSEGLPMCCDELWK